MEQHQQSSSSSNPNLLINSKPTLNHQSLSQGQISKPYQVYLREKINRSLERKDFFSNKKEFRNVFQHYMKQGLVQQELQQQSVYFTMMQHQHQLQQQKQMQGDLATILNLDQPILNNLEENLEIERSSLESNDASPISEVGKNSKELRRFKSQGDRFKPAAARDLKAFLPFQDERDSLG